MNRFLHQHLLLPAFETGFKRRATLRYWRDLERTQWLTRDAVEDLQFQALRRLIAHAYQRCPYYRTSWDAIGLHPRRLGTPSDLTRWPIIERETVRTSRVAMRADNPPLKLISKATGGSSGVPLQFDLDPDSHDRRAAAWHRGYGWASASPGTKQLHLWGAPAGTRPLRARVKDHLYHALYRRRFVSCIDADGNLAVRFAREVNRYRPEAIVAYTNPLFEVARQIDESGIQLTFRPASILVGAEKLHAFQRETIERVFGAPVFETYGSREFMLIGSECEQHAGLHVTAEHLFVEVLDDNGLPTSSGQEGNVVITDLYNYGMPFIRYANGDRAIAGFGLCACGRGLPVLKKVVGRRLDMLVATGGRVLPGEFFPHLVKDFPAVRRFQVVQEETDRVRFALVADGMAAVDRQRLEYLVREALGPGVRVDFEPLSNIPLTAAGKLRVVVNHVPHRRAG